MATYTLKRPAFNHAPLQRPRPDSSRVPLTIGQAYAQKAALDRPPQSKAGQS